MILNIWTLIVAMTLLMIALLFTLWKRPRMPLMTLILILELVFFLLGSNTVNNFMTPTGNSMIQQTDMGLTLLRLLLGGGEQTIKTYEVAFGNLQVIVLVLIAATVISIVVESYLILIKPIRVENRVEENEN